MPPSKTILKVIVVFIAVAIVVVVLGLIPVYRRSSEATATITTIATITVTTTTQTTNTGTTVTTTSGITTSTTSTTTVTITSGITTSTTSTTTQSPLQRIITQCQSDKSTNINRQIKIERPKIKMQLEPNVLDGRVLLKNSYLVEFAPDSSVKEHFRTISNSLKTSHNIPQSAIKIRHTIQSELFSGVSFSLTVNHSVEALEMIEDAIAIYPIYIVPRPRPLRNYMSTDKSYDHRTDSINSHNLTGVSQVHQELHGFGKGVRVAVIDSGIYYKHPALGGCFGSGCKVEFGYDFVGDTYGIYSWVPEADYDPMDNCSYDSHGTHVAGIIGANATGINNPAFISNVPFVGVAPQVTLGAYRVFGCNGDTTTDIITQAIYRAYADKADIINLSLGSASVYTVSSDVIAIQRVMDAGVYVAIATGNSGNGGLQTAGSPGSSLGPMAVGSIDTVDQLSFLGMSTITGGTPSSFTSFGLTDDLLVKPQISSIGGKVYSTISLAAAAQQKLNRTYDLLSGTSMATPFLAGTLALFLENIGNPSPDTASGYAANGICRPKFYLVTNIFQSTAMLVKNYDSTLFSTVAQQGAGLVNVYQALSSTTLISPTEFALNDTVRKAGSYKFNVTNIGNNIAVYQISHSGAALATGLTSNDDQLLSTPLYSANYANVIIDQTNFQLNPGELREINVQFQAPTVANSVLLPIYSGFIYVKNTVNGQVSHVSYAGVVGDYWNAQIIVRKTSSGIISGILNANGQYVTDNQLMTLYASQGIQIRIVLAWCTRNLFIEAVSAQTSNLSGSYNSYGRLYSNGVFDFINMERNVRLPEVQSFYQAYQIYWYGYIYTGSATNNRLSSGQYRIRFSALKHFGNVSNSNDYETYVTPPFILF